jgi:uncharacterized surface protein with fasciclin (FAS1) repeats
MNIRRKTVAARAAASLAVVPAVALAPSAQAAKGTPLAAVLAADAKKNGTPSYDTNKKDFDILLGAVQTVLDKKPSSPVAVLADPSVRLTAFIPNDGAFIRTAADLGITAKNEKRLLTKLANTLGVGGVEEVLLYHVVPGKKLTATKVVAAGDGTVLTMANGETTTVKIRDNGTIRLRDKVPAVTNPKVIATDINKKKGNKQVAHVINRVLLPSL